MRHSADRHRRGVGRRSGRRSSRSAAPCCSARAGDRDRSSCPSASRWRAAGGAITINFDEESVLERLQELTHGKAREVHRCRRHGGACRAQPRLDGRSRQAGRDARHRSPARAARDDVRVPAGRHAVGARRLRRLPRQDSVRRGDEQGPDASAPARPTSTAGPTTCCAASSRGRSIRRSSSRTPRASTDGPQMYHTFRDKQDGCIKVVLKPNGNAEFTDHDIAH